MGAALAEATGDADDEVVDCPGAPLGVMLLGATGEGGAGVSPLGVDVGDAVGDAVRVGGDAPGSLQAVKRSKAVSANATSTALLRPA